MKLKVDKKLCQGHNRCVVLAGDLFDADDDGYAFIVRQPETEEEIQLARRIVRACPERAVILSEDRSRV